MAAPALVLLAQGCVAPAVDPTAVPGGGRQETELSRGTVTSVALVSVTVVPASEKPVPKIARVEVRPDLIELGARESVALTATAFDEQDQRLPTVRFAWSMVDPRAGHTDARGRLTAGDTAGHYRDAVLVTAVLTTPAGTTYERAFASVTIVGESIRPVLAQVGVLPSRLLASSGQIIRLQAFGYDAEGHIMPETQFRWSLRQAVGRLNQLGYLTVESPPGLYPGAVVVEGRMGEKAVFVSVDLEVREAASLVGVLTVQLLPRQIEIAPGEAFQFNAVSLDQEGRPLPQVRLAWVMANPEAGTLSPNGVFQAGTTQGVYVDAVRVEVSSLAGRQQLRASGFASVIVRAPKPPRPLASLRMEPKSVVTFPGQTSVLAAVARDDTGRLAKGIQAVWDVAEPAAGRITSDGRFIATRTPGRYLRAIHLTATQRLGDQAVTLDAFADVIVAGDVVRVQVTPAQAVVASGETIHFTAVGFDADGTAIPGLIFRWRVQRPKAGSIDPLGNFKAGDQPGGYRDAIQVTAVQRRPR
ncbi:MAG: hypothetical protein HY688_01610 [Chloroflexi bacterium]|nr:hypothetical protein [Chloroflexota bacterium]